MTAKQPASDGDQPLGSYAVLVSTFATGVGTFVLTRGRKLPRGTSWSDFALVALASHKVSRLITKDDVTKFIRAPVTEDADAQEPSPQGPRRAIGELVTCPYCIDLWLAAGLNAALVTWRRETRFVAAVFATQAASDFLHAAFTRLRDS